MGLTVARRRGRGPLAVILAALLTLWLALPGAQAQTVAQEQQGRIDALMEVMGLDAIIAIMREEGLAYGDELGREMLAQGGGAAWDMLVDRIYDVDKMTMLVRRQFHRAFGDADPAPLIAFFESETGARIVELEVAARRAFMDATIEEAAREAFRRVEADLDAPSPRGIDPHLSAIEAYIEVNDLIGFNVMGAMNANMLFYRGLIEGGAMEMTDADIVADVWAQEEDTRAETREWIYAFLMLAYEPLDAAQIHAYADLSATAAGRAMNRALFESFDLMYGEVSRALGMAIAGQMLGEEL
jgi:hypothetical protein